MSLDFSNIDNTISIKAGPRKFPFLNDLDLSNEVISKLHLNLNRIVSGSDDVYLTPIGKLNDPDSLLKSLDKIFEDNSSVINNNLMSLEQSNRSKFGPRSLAKTWVDRKESLLDYFKRRECSFNELAVKFRSKSNLRPLSVVTASKYLKSNTNSGLPYYTSKGKVLDTLLSTFKSTLDRQDPCVLFTRTQEDYKTRNVWGYPIADTLNEMRYYQPLLEYQRKLNWRSALLGPKFVDEAVTSMMKSSNNHTDCFVSIDFSSFDASVGYKLQKASFDYIKSLYQSSFNSDLDYIFNRFNTIGIVTPDGVISGSHGVPSGATFTNEVDSISQYLIAKSTLIDCRFQIQGDDGAYLLPESKVEDLYGAFGLAGLTVNKTKSYSSKDFIVYLQRLYDFKYEKNKLIGGIYPLYRALNRIIYQERYSDFMDYSLKGSDYYSIRTICILENCKYHPLFKEFVKLIISKDKYSLKFAADAINKYSRMLNSGSGTAGLLDNQYGDNVKGIYNFDTLKVIKELG